MNRLSNGFDPMTVGQNMYTQPSQAEKAFVEAMTKSGIPFLGRVVGDGQIHRFETGKKGRKNGWYAFFGSAGAYGDWSRDIHERWSVSQELGSKEDKDQLKKQIAKTVESAQAELKRREKEVADYALKKWNCASEVGSSLYLERKKVEPYGVRFGNSSLIIPIRDIEGKLWSLQYIQENGNKRFLRGGRKKGGHLD